GRFAARLPEELSAIAPRRRRGALHLTVGPRLPPLLPPPRRVPRGARQPPGPRPHRDGDPRRCPGHPPTARDAEAKRVQGLVLPLEPADLLQEERRGEHAAGDIGADPRPRGADG